MPLCVLKATVIGTVYPKGKRVGIGVDAAPHAYTSNVR